MAGLHAYSRFFLTILVCGLVFFGSPAYAQQDSRDVFLDAQTRKRGYTISFDQEKFSLAVEPDSLRKDARVIVKKYADEEKELSSKIPTLYELASPMYQYDFGDVYPQDFKKGIIVRIRDKIKGAQIAFYDRTRERWDILPTSVSTGNVRSARMRLAFAQVALIREKPWRTNSHIVASLIPARAVYVANESGHRYVGKAIHQQLPLASITKLMTALVFLEHNPGWKKLVTIQRSDDSDSSRVNFRNGEKIFVRDLFESMLVGSKNNAAKALARSTGLGAQEFVKRMNAKTRDLGLYRTYFADPTGLDPKNVSSAAEIMQIARIAFGQEDIRTATKKKKLSFQAQNTGRWFSVRTTDEMLGYGIAINGAKTGFINESGYNFVVETVHQGKRLFVVILGARDTHARFELASELIGFVHERSSR